MKIFHWYFMELKMWQFLKKPEFINEAKSKKNSSVNLPGPFAFNIQPNRKTTRRL